jgi:hypothetical protein
MLAKPILVAPLLLQHPIQICAKLPGGRNGRLGLPLRAQQPLIVRAHGAWRQLVRLNDLDDDPLEPGTPAPDMAVLRLAAGAVRARHQARIGGQFLRAPKARDGADLRLQQERPEGADAGNGLQALRDGILPNVALNVLVQREDLLREQVEVGEQEIHLPADDGGQGDGRQPGPSRPTVQIKRRTPQVLGREIGVNAVLEDRALAHQKRAAAQELSVGARDRIRNPDRRQQVHAGEFGELARVDGIGLGARLPDELDLIRVGDLDAVALRRELLLEPRPVERRLQHDRQRSREARKPGVDGGEVGRESPLFGDQAAIHVDRTGGDVALMQIHADVDHTASRSDTGEAVPFVA